MARGYMEFRVGSRGPDGRPVAVWLRDYEAKFPRKVFRPAAADALTRTAKKAYTRSVRYAAAQTQVPQKIIRDKSWVIPARTRPGRLYSGLGIMKRGINPVRLNYRYVRKGLRAGKHYWERGFVNRVRTNSTLQGLQRVGMERYPIVLVRIPIKGLERFDTILGRYARTFLPARFAQQLKYRSEKLTKGGA